MEPKYIKNFKNLLESDRGNIKGAYLEIMCTPPARFKDKAVLQQMNEHLNYVKIAKNYSDFPNESNKALLQSAIEEIQNSLTTN
jgi:hypothetical protein